MDCGSGGGGRGGSDEGSGSHPWLHVISITRRALKIPALRLLSRIDELRLWQACGDLKNISSFQTLPGDSNMQARLRNTQLRDTQGPKE